MSKMAKEQICEDDAANCKKDSTKQCDHRRHCTDNQHHDVGQAQPCAASSHAVVILEALFQSASPGFFVWKKVLKKRKIQSWSSGSDFAMAICSFKQLANSSPLPGPFPRLKWSLPTAHSFWQLFWCCPRKRSCVFYSGRAASAEAVPARGYNNSSGHASQQVTRSYNQEAHKSAEAQNNESHIENGAIRKASGQNNLLDCLSRNQTAAWLLETTQTAKPRPTLGFLSR